MKPQSSAQSERPLTLDQVKTLSVGTRVNIHGEDSEGHHRVLECTVAGRDGQKFLTYRDHGTIKRCPIKDYPGKTYTKAIGG